MMDFNVNSKGFFKEDACIATDTIMRNSSKRRDGKVVYFKEF